MTNLTPEQARNAVNVFASIDVLGLLDYAEYPHAGGTIEHSIKEFYNTLLRPNHAALMDLAMTLSLQSWNPDRERYEFQGIWNHVIGLANGAHKVFASTQGTQELLGKYVRLIANRGDTQGWKLAVDQSDLNNGYLTEAYNLSIKAKPGQWIRWWGNSMTPFSALQCVVGSITTANRPQPLPEVVDQHASNVQFLFPSGRIDDTGGESTYTTATSTAFSWVGQLRNSEPVGRKIQYDIKFNLLDPQGDIIAAFQVDPEIIVIE